MPATDKDGSTYLYHVADNEDVERARESGVYRSASLLREGFIHACYLHQLGGVLERYYPEADDVQLMLIDTDGLEVPLVNENLIGGSELFPHLYGELPMASVVDCLPFSRQSGERQSMNHLRIERQGAVGYLTLNRPEALNALTLAMIQLFEAGLEAHLADENVQLIVVRSTDDRAFCAGGDIKQVYRQVLDGEVDQALDMLRAEYRLNAKIAAAGKPFVALIDGIAMGGGLGISIHGSHRVVSERVSMAMPECRIGFIPDVGATFFLPRLAQRTGVWLGTTSMTVRGFETLAVGLATHQVAHTAFPALMEALEAQQPGQTVDALIEQFTAPAVDQTELDRFTDKCRRIARWFASDEISEIQQALAAAVDDKDPDALKILQAWEGVSPHARGVTARLLAAGAERDLQDCLDAEWQAAAELLSHPDFCEGVRAVLVDKDGQPRWQE